MKEASYLGQGGKNSVAVLKNMVCWRILTGPSKKEGSCGEGTRFVDIERWLSLGMGRGGLGRIL